MDPQSPVHDTATLKLRVSLKGRPIRSLSFDQDVVTIGRDPESDVFLDNPGVSRNHSRIEKTPTGFSVQDAGSANGTYLNDETIQEARLEHEDVLRVGKFTLWVGLEASEAPPPPVEVQEAARHEGTTVLSTGDLEKMLTKLREFDPGQANEDTKSSTRNKLPGAGWPALALVFALGAVLGAATVWLLRG